MFINFNYAILFHLYKVIGFFMVLLYKLSFS